MFDKNKYMFELINKLKELDFVKDVDIKTDYTNFLGDFFDWYFILYIDEWKTKYTSIITNIINDAIWEIMDLTDNKLFIDMFWEWKTEEVETYAKQ